MIVNVITRPAIKLEHPEDLSVFYECRTFLYKKILSGYVRVIDLSSFLPPLLNNVGLTVSVYRIASRRLAKIKFISKLATKRSKIATTLIFSPV